FSSRRRHTRFSPDWSSDVCSSDLLNCLVEVLFWQSLAKLQKFAIQIFRVFINLLINWKQLFISQNIFFDREILLIFLQKYIRAFLQCREPGTTKSCEHCCPHPWALFTG